MLQCSYKYLYIYLILLFLGLTDFIRVQKAKLDTIPIFTYVVPHPNLCAKKCKELKGCRSFNYNNEHEICELCSKNAASNIVLRSIDCKNRDYYQRKGIV